MRINYTRFLSLSADAISEKEAQKDLKEAFNRIKAFALAFGLSVKITPGRSQIDSPIYYFNYTFTFRLEVECDFGSVLELAAAIKAFAHFNMFEIGEEKAQFAEDES
jgi:hypothetical protein